MGTGEQVVEVGEGSEDRVDVAEVRHVVAGVALRGAVERRQPDGVHAEVGERVESGGDAREVADADGSILVAVTFSPHPMAVLRPEHAPTALTSLERRADLLGEAGADAVLAASIFHFGDVAIGEVKDAMADAGIEVRR